MVLHFKFIFQTNQFRFIQEIHYTEEQFAHKTKYAVNGD